MMKVPFINLAVQHEQIGDEVFFRLNEICATGRFVLGPFVEQFERSFAQYCDVDHCVGVNTGTSALHLALRCLGIGPGDEVITVPMTFIATTWAISYVGATPIFVDIDPASRTMSPELLEAALTPRTKAILPVHLYGMPADMEPILHLAGKYKIPVIEDACQAHGARYEGRRVGGLGVIGCFSFYPSKNLGAYGEGGALVTNDPDIAAQARRLRDHAQPERYKHDSLGYNYRMDAFQGAVLDVKLKHLDDWNAARQRHAVHYRQRLKHVEGITLPDSFPDRESVYHLFVIELDERDRLAKQLRSLDVETGLHYPIPVHLQEAYHHLGLREGRFPVAERLGRRCLSLPMFPEMTEEQIDYVCDQVMAALGQTAAVAPIP